MIKKYFDFIKENVTIGEKVEKLALKNKDILELIQPFIGNTNPSVRISNTINSLDNEKKDSIKKILDNYSNENKEELQAGKNVFQTFLKIITSLGLKDIKPSWSNLPDNYLLFFEYKCEYASAMEKIERFASLSMFKDKLPKEKCYLYYGISIMKNKKKLNLSLNFGFKEDSKIIKIGSFNINNGVFKKLSQLESPSSAHFRKELSHLTYNKLKILGEVADHMKSYNPGDTEDKSFKIEDGVLEFGYKGLGKWTDGKMDENEKDRLRKGFTEHLLKFDNKHHIEASVKPDEKSWIRLNVRIKKDV